MGDAAGEPKKRGCEVVSLLPRQNDFLSMLTLILHQIASVYYTLVCCIRWQMINDNIPNTDASQADGSGTTVTLFKPMI